LSLNVKAALLVPYVIWIVGRMVNYLQYILWLLLFFQS